LNAFHAGKCAACLALAAAGLLAPRPRATAELPPLESPCPVPIARTSHARIHRHPHPLRCPSPSWSSLLLAVDFFVLKHEGEHQVSTREAAMWTLIWISIALAFGGWLWWYLDGTVAGPEVAKPGRSNIFTGYLIEKSLAVDNVFVWITLFNFFAVPAVFQKRVLLYGVLGAIVLRAMLIYVGALLLAQFHWILYIFGLFLLYTGIRRCCCWPSTSRTREQQGMLRWLRGHMKITDEYHGDHFFVVLDGVRYATPLFLVLVHGRGHRPDLRGRFDPAIFAVTGRPVHRVHLEHLRHPRPARDVLPAGRHGAALPPAEVRAGADPHLHRRKMLLLDIYKIPVGIALGVVGIILLASVLASLATSKKV
jgi:tellurite resistance protein TerC